MRKSFALAASLLLTGFTALASAQSLTPQQLEAARALVGNGGASMGAVSGGAAAGLSGAAGFSIPGSTTPVLRAGSDTAADTAVQAKPQSRRQSQSPITNEFQTFIRQTTGRNLPLFGYELLRNAAADSFAAPEAVPVTADYVVGPGDEVLIRAWGAIDADVRAVVDRNGEIAIPKVGVFSVAGVRYQDLAATVRARMARVYRNFELSVTLGKLRAIRVLLTGQAENPGAYTLSAQSTLLSALFATGGPSVNGTLRAVQLKRDNQVVTEFDLYALLINGDKSKDLRLQQGDIIHIPPVTGFAAVSGSVRQPGIYEIAPGMTLQSLLDLAGGLTTTARTRLATIETIENRSTRRVGEFALEGDTLQRPVADGDLISVFSISPRFENAVTLRGNVAEPMRFGWREGMRIRDLIPSREALVTPDYWVRRNLAVRTETKGEAALKNEVSRALAEPHWDYAVVERLKDDLTTTLIPFNLGRAVFDSDPGENLLLQPGDVVTIFSQDDMNIPQDRKTKFVRVEGEVAMAGVYRIEPGETLKQLVTRVGGLTPKAYLYGASFTRDAVRETQQKQLDEAADRLEQTLLRITSQETAGLSRSEDIAAFDRQIASQHALVNRLRNAKALGRIVLEMPTDATLANLPEIPLEDGDRFYIPPRPATVSVFGSVYNQTSFIYRDGKNGSDYLDQAGGPTKDGDDDSIFVLKADGSVVSATNGWLFSSIDRQPIMPGDAIIVPERFVRFNLTRELKDWSQIIYQFALGVAGLKVLKDL